MTKKETLIARRKTLVDRLHELEEEFRVAIDTYADIQDKYEGVGDDSDTLQRHIESYQLAAQNIDNHRKQLDDAVSELTELILSDDE